MMSSSLKMRTVVPRKVRSCIYLCLGPGSLAFDATPHPVSSQVVVQKATRAVQVRSVGDDINRGAQNIKETAQDAARDVQDAAKEGYKQAKDFVQGNADDAKGAIDKGVDNAKDTGRDLKNDAEKVGKDLKNEAKKATN